jgi:hypothetical protein
MRAGHVSVPAVLAIVVVTLVGGALVLLNLLFAWGSTLGPDACDEALCRGDGVRAGIFLLLAVAGGIAVIGTWFCASSARRSARYLLSVIAIFVPVVFDLIVLAGAPDWLV